MPDFSNLWQRRVNGVLTRFEKSEISRVWQTIGQVGQKSGEVWCLTQPGWIETSEVWRQFDTQITKLGTQKSKYGPFAELCENEQKSLADGDGCKTNDI